MKNKPLVLLLSGAITLFSGLVIAQDQEVDGSGLPPLAEEGEIASLPSDVPQLPREEELFGNEILEELIEPEPEEGEVVERGVRRQTLNRYAAYSARRFPVAATRVPMRAQPACTDKVINRSIRAYPLARKVDGDNEMTGEVSIRIDGELVRTNGRIIVRGSVDMEAGGNVKNRRLLKANKLDTSHFRHTFDQSIFDVTREAPGCRITNVSYNRPKNAGASPSRGGEIYAKSPGGNHAFSPYESRSSRRLLFTSATCRADVKGADAGQIGCSAIRVHSLKVHLAPLDNGKACQTISFPLPGNGGGMPYVRGGYRDLYPIRRIRGNSNVKGNIATNVISKVLWDAGRVRLYNRVRMAERGNDNSVYDSASTSTMIQAALDAPGCKITGVSVGGGALAGRADFVTKTQQWTKTKDGTGKGMLDHVLCRSNEGGNDDQKIGCTGFRYHGNVLRVNFE